MRVLRLAAVGALVAGSFVLVPSSAASGEDPCSKLPNGGKVTIKAEGPKVDPGCSCALPLPANFVLGYSDGTKDTCEFKAPPNGANTGRCRNATVCPPGSERIRENGVVRCRTFVDQTIECKAPPVPTPSEVQSQVSDTFYRAREAAAPESVKRKLTELRTKIAQQKLPFEVGATGVAALPFDKLTGFKHDLQFAKAIAGRPALPEPAGVLPADEEAACMRRARFDWRERGKVTPVKSQGECGSCWAFTATATIESSVLLRENVSLDLSEQAVIQCAGVSPVSGSGPAIDAGSCDGGDFDIAYDALFRFPDGSRMFVAGDMRNMASESDAPYQTSNGGACPSPLPLTTTEGLRITVEGWGRVSPTPDGIKRALCKHGPLATSMYADELFQRYAGGLYTTLVPPIVNHAVTIVGWDESAWIIKNSWGTDWGTTAGQGSERGYARVKIGSNNIGLWTAWVRAKVDRSMARSTTPARAR